MPPPEPVTLPAPDSPNSTASARQPVSRRASLSRLLQGSSVRDRLGVTLFGLIGLIHIAAVAPTYRFGSFDDDASYVMTARALAHLHGLTSTLPVGLPLAATYPTGYPALIAPLAAIGGDAIVPMRVLSVLFALLLFPLTWIWLRNRGFDRGFTYAVLALLALNPVLATYGSMVMAEAPFVGFFVLALIALERWVTQRSTWTGAGIAVIVLLPTLVWFKQAGIGVAAGALAYLLWRRAFRKALAAAAGLFVLVLPLLIARVMTSTPLLGSRYSSELDGTAFGTTGGGLWHRVTSVPPQAISLYWRWAVPDSVVPTAFRPLSTTDWLQGASTVLRLSVAPVLLLGVIGWIVRLRRTGAGGVDASLCMVGVYFLETLLYPYTNERRIVLVLPVALAWSAFGIRTLGQLLEFGGRRLSARNSRRPLRMGAALVAVVIAVPLMWQFSRNYMLPIGDSTSAPASSASMTMLRQLGTPADLVESDYIWTTSLLTGHRARNSFFQTCADDEARAAAREDRAVYVLTNGFAVQGIGSPCGIEIVSRLPSAVRLYRTARDSTAVFALIGPGTARPDETDLTGARSPEAETPVAELPEPQQLDEEAGAYPTTPTTEGTADFTWTFPRAGRVQQVSLGAAGADTTNAVEIEIRTPDGRWRRMAHADGPVGEGQRTPFLLAVLRQPIVATAMRVRITGSGTAYVHDAHALGVAS